MNPSKQSPDKSRTRLWAGLVLTIAGSAALLFWWTSGPERTDSRRGQLAEQRDTPEKDASPEDRKSSSRATPREADRLLKAQGAKTDVSLATFPIKEYQHLPSPSGKPTSITVGDAYIHVPSAGRRVAMESNQLGEFPTIETRLKDTVGIRVSLDSVKPGTPVRVVILDGGSFPAVEGVSQVLEAAAWRGVAFEYTTSANIGTHRVLVQAVGQPSRIFDFSAHDAKGSWPAPSTVSTN